VAVRDAKVASTRSKDICLDVGHVLRVPCGPLDEAGVETSGDASSEESMNRGAGRYWQQSW